MYEKELSIDLYQSNDQVMHKGKLVLRKFKKAGEMSSDCDVIQIDINDDDIIYTYINGGDQT
jgi:hypothetical protein